MNTEFKPSAGNTLIGKKVLALSGGVGGAKLALGLSKLLDPDQLVIAVNTADDFEHLGLNISPDLDTLAYTLAGLSDQKQGWGLADESWNAMAVLETLGGESWFRLGDKDLATHLYRTERLSAGMSLTEVTREICSRLGVNHLVLPMSNDPVRTRMVLDQIKNAGNATEKRDIPFQEYFVREQCKPAIKDFYFEGIERAQPQAQLMELLNDDALAAIIICPSNPFVSVEPILQLKGLREAIALNPAPVIAVSPIVGGRSIKGPTGKMMNELGMLPSAASIADYYGSLIDGFVIDSSDEALKPSIEDMNCSVFSSSIIMKTLDDRVALANNVLEFSCLCTSKNALASGQKH